MTSLRDEDAETVLNKGFALAVITPERKLQKVILFLISGLEKDTKHKLDLLDHF